MSLFSDLIPVDVARLKDLSYNRSMSRDLSVLADRVIDVYESDIKGKYKHE